MTCGLAARHHPTGDRRRCSCCSALNHSPRTEPGVSSLSTTITDEVEATTMSTPLPGVWSSPRLSVRGPKASHPHRTCLSASQTLKLPLSSQLRAPRHPCLCPCRHSSLKVPVDDRRTRLGPLCLDSSRSLAANASLLTSNCVDFASSRRARHAPHAPPQAEHSDFQSGPASHGTDALHASNHLSNGPARTLSCPLLARSDMRPGPGLPAPSNMIHAISQQHTQWKSPLSRCGHLAYSSLLDPRHFGAPYS